MIIALAVAASIPGVLVPNIVSGQHYVCMAQGITPHFVRTDDTIIVIDGNDWLFDATLANLTRVPKASATIVDGEMTLSAPVPGEPTARFKARVGQEVGDSRVILDWETHRPEPNFSDLSSGLAVCNLSPESARQEKKS